MGQQLTTCCGPCNADSARQFQGINGDMDDMKKVPIELTGTSELDAKFARGNGAPSTPESVQDTPSNRNSDSGNPKVFTFRSMTRTDYFELYDAIHTLVRQDELSKDEENVMYDMIGRQDKKLAAAYQCYKESGDPMVLLEPLKDRMSLRMSTGSRR